MAPWDGAQKEEGSVRKGIKPNLQMPLPFPCPTLCHPIMPSPRRKWGWVGTGGLDLGSLACIDKRVLLIIMWCLLLQHCSTMAVGIESSTKVHTYMYMERKQVTQTSANAYR
jgi:hypothetical protein